MSPFTGIVRKVDEVLADPFDVRLPNVYCETGHVAPLIGHGQLHKGAGSARTRDLARAAALAEALERYSACASGLAAATVAPASRLARAVDPSRFALYSEAQLAEPGFRYARLDRGTPVAWVEGWSLPDGQPVLVPAQLVYLVWDLLPGEQLVAHATSSGLACHATFAEAVLSGLLELVERDAFMLTWKGRLGWPRLATGGSDALASFERRYLEPTGLRVSALDLSAVWRIPCVVAVARSRAPGEAPLGVGAAAATTVERAFEKACDEAVRVRSWARALRAHDPAGADVPPPAQIRSFEEHIQHFAYDAAASAADFLDASDEVRQVAEVEPVPGSSTAEAVAAICARLAERGASAYAVDVTAPDVRAAGLRVARVLATELCQLDVEHAARYDGGRRLYLEPVRLGFRSTPLDPADLNPEPHPFP